MRQDSSSAHTWPATTRETRCAVPTAFSRVSGSGLPRPVAALSFSRSSRGFRSSHCGATSTRGYASASERGLDAVVLAAAGLTRLGLGSEIGHRFAPDELVPEAGQGAVALQVRTGEESVVAEVDDPATRRQVEAERACVAHLGAGCLAPVAAHHDGRELTALIAAEDGSWLERRTGSDPVAVARVLAKAAAARAESAARLGGP